MLCVGDTEAPMESLEILDRSAAAYIGERWPASVRGVRPIDHSAVDPRDLRLFLLVVADPDGVAEGVRVRAELRAGLRRAGVLGVDPVGLALAEELLEARSDCSVGRGVTAGV